MAVSEISSLDTKYHSAGPRFRGYEKVEETFVYVENGILFGDCEDVKLSNFNKTKPILPRKGDTIVFTKRLVTSAVKGNYIHGRIFINSQIRKEVCVLHLIHHESVDGEKLGRFLCHSTGMEKFRCENVWNRYDWCHFRNWGPYEACDRKIHFVSFSEQGTKELGRFSIAEADVITGDWNYGARLTGADGKAYAYIYGDCLVHEAQTGEKIGVKTTKTDFKEPIEQFMTSEEITSFFEK